MSKTIFETIAQVDVHKTSVHDALLLGMDMNWKKEELYTAVAENMHKAYPYKVTKKDGKWTMEMPEDFSKNITAGGIGGVIGWCTLQFPEYPSETVKDENGKKTKINIAFTRLQTMIKEQTTGVKDHKITREGIRAFTAINRFSAWYSGYKLGIIRDYANAELEQEIQAKFEELKKPLGKDALKNEEVMSKTYDKAKALVREAHKKNNPRLFDAKNNVNIPQIKTLPDDKKAAVTTELAKFAPEAMIEALKAAGKPVVPASSIAELQTKTLLDMLAKRATSGEFKNPEEVKKAIAVLQKNLTPAKTVDTQVNGTKTNGRKKAANA